MIKIFSLSSRETSSYSTNLSCEYGRVGITSDFVFHSHDGELKFAKRDQDSKLVSFVDGKEYSRDGEGIIVWSENQYYSTPTSSPIKFDLSDVDINAERNQQKALWQSLNFDDKFIYYNAGAARYPSYGRVVKDTSEGRSYYLNLKSGENNFLKESIRLIAGSKILTTEGAIYDTEKREKIGEFEAPKQCQEIQYSTNQGLWMKYNEEGTELTDSGNSGYCYYEFDSGETYLYTKNYAGEIVYAEGRTAITEGFGTDYVEVPVKVFTASAVDGKNYCEALEINSKTTCSVDQVSCECRLNTSELEENITLSISEDKKSSIKNVEQKYDDLKNRSQEIKREEKNSASPAWLILKFQVQRFLAWF